jgi:hypothetical protein
MDKILNLLNQIIEKHEWEDSNNPNRKPGDTWDLHHLKLLKQMLEEYNNAKN